MLTLIQQYKSPENVKQADSRNGAYIKHQTLDSVKYNTGNIQQLPMIFSFITTRTMTIQSQMGRETAIVAIFETTILAFND